MKRTSGISLCLILIFFVNAVGASEWSDDNYATYDYASFAKLPDVLARINMEKIDYPLLHAAIFYETNRQRVLNGLPQFGHSAACERAAKGHSDDMVEFNFFSHTSTVKGKETIVKWFALEGIKNAEIAENIAKSFGIEYSSGKAVYPPSQNGGYFSYEYKGEPIRNHTYIGLAKAVVNQLMNSPVHRANILNKALKFLGTGASHYRDAEFYNIDCFKCVQNFPEQLR